MCACGSAHAGAECGFGRDGLPDLSRLAEDATHHARARQHNWPMENLGFTMGLGDGRIGEDGWWGSVKGGQRGRTKDGGGGHGKEMVGAKFPSCGISWSRGEVSERQRARTSLIIWPFWAALSSAVFLVRPDGQLMVGEKRDEASEWERRKQRAWRAATKGSVRHAMEIRGSVVVDCRIGSVGYGHGACGQCACESVGVRVGGFG